MCPLVVHEVNGQDGVHLLSAAQVDELILAADRATDKDVERAAHRAAASPAEEAAEPPSSTTREMTTASGDEFGGPRDSGPWEPVAGTGSAPDRQAADRTEAERDRMASPPPPPPPGGGAGPEAAAPPPTLAPMPRTDERESVGGPAETATKGEKACKCCSLM